MRVIKGMDEGKGKLLLVRKREKKGQICDIPLAINPIFKIILLD